MFKRAGAASPGASRLTRRSELQTYESDSVAESKEGDGMKPPTPVYNSRDLLSWIGAGRKRRSAFDGPAININKVMEPNYGV